MSIASVLLAAASGTPSAQQPAASELALTNADVVRLMKLGLGDDVVIAKIHQAAAVNFDLSPDGLAKLKSNGVSKEAITAMLKRATPPSEQPQRVFLAAPNPGSPGPEVLLRSKDRDIELVGRQGVMSATIAFVAILRFCNYPGAASKILITDPRPVIVARLEGDPRDRQERSLAFLVKLDPDRRGDKRSLKIGQLGARIGFGSPDTDWTLPFDAEPDSPGLWRIIPKADLPPGEYGFYLSAIGRLYDFAVGR